MGVELPATGACAPEGTAGTSRHRVGAGRATLASLGLLVVSCGDLLPAIELGSSSTTGVEGSSTTGLDASGEGGSSTDTSSTGPTTESTTTSADSESSTGVPEPGCDNGRVEPGEICYGELLEFFDLGLDLCDVDLGDVLGDDGDPELLALPCSQTQLQILPGTPAGLDPMLITRDLGPGVGSTLIRRIEVADYSGDGRPDVVAPNDAAPELVIYTDLAPSPIVAYTPVAATASYYQLVAGEFAGDDNPDLLAGSVGFGDIVVFRGTGIAGNPLLQEHTIDPSQTSYEARIADLDGDGQTDLVLAHKAMPYRLEPYPGVSNGFNPQPPQFVDVPAAIFGLTTGQFDGGAGLDVAISPYDGTTVTVYPQTNGVTLGAGQAFMAGPGASRMLATIDLDDDGLDDLVTAQAMGGQNYLVLSTNVGGVGFQVQRMFLLDPPGVGSDVAEFLRVVDLNRDGVDDVVVVTLTSRVLLLLSTP